MVAVAGALLLLVLGVFAISLSNSQQRLRRDVQTRFRERAQVSASLTDALFSAAAAQSAVDAVDQFGGPRIKAGTLKQFVKQGRLVYARIIGPDGKVLGASAGAPATARRSPATGDHIRAALKGKVALSSVLHGQGSRASVIEYALPFQTPTGLRVQVSGLSAALMYSFLGDYLAKVPNVKGGQAYVLDARGNVVAGRSKTLKPGQRLPDAPLLRALADRRQGSYDGSREFTSAPVGLSPWRVVLVAPKSRLFASVNGARKWLPWAIFAAFALAAAASLVLLRRVVTSAARLRAANRELEAANESLGDRATELSRSNAELEQFAVIASHDLQEPLRKIGTFGDLLETKYGEQLPDAGREHLARMRNAAVRMQALIEDLLRFSRVTTDTRPFVPVDLGRLTTEVLADLDAVTEELGARIEVDELPVIDADPSQMRQLLQNLISNALKFHREEVPPVVRIHAEIVRGQRRRSTTSGSVPDRCEISVTDNGIGFDEQYSERIFRVFERLHGRGAYAGTGIGLALCRKIAERHGGHIQARSTLGHGATFVVTLPVTHAGRSRNGDGQVRDTEEKLVHA